MHVSVHFEVEIKTQINLYIETK